MDAVETYIAQNIQALLEDLRPECEAVSEDLTEVIAQIVLVENRYNEIAARVRELTRCVHKGRSNPSRDFGNVEIPQPLEPTSREAWALPDRPLPPLPHAAVVAAVHAETHPEPEPALAG